MIISPIIIWACMLIVFIYTMGFAKTLWKEDKGGAVVVIIIAIGVIFSPFLSILR